MTFKEVATMVSSIGLSYAYDHFPENSAPDLPYVVFHYPSSNDFGADNENYVSIDNLAIELYTENKDFTNESNVEAVLSQNGLFFDKTETYLNTEHMYMVLYEIQIITE